MTMSITRPAKSAFAICGLLVVVGLLATSANARTLAEVKALGAISVCLNPDALPYSSKKPERPGFQLELAREIAGGLGVSLNVDWILPRRRANVVNCDMLLDTFYNPDNREGRLLLSRPYQVSSVVLGLSKGATPIKDYQELLPGQKVGVMAGSIAGVVLGKAGKSTSPYSFQDDLVGDVANGSLYAGAVSGATMSYYIREHPESGLVVTHAFDSVPDLHWEVSVGLRKSDRALVDAVNQVLDKLISQGTLTSIYQRYGVEHRVP